MADGPEKFEKITPASKPGGDPSERLIADTQGPMPGKGQEVAPVGDNSPGKIATGTDSKGYNFDVASEVPPGLQGHFAGSPQENLTASNERIQGIYAKVTTPEGQAALNVAAQQMVDHFKTPGLDKVATT